jgi:asparagine synthase (glutamine-hydrolysing)
MKRLLYDLNNDLAAGFQRRTTVSHQFRQSLYSKELIEKLIGHDAGNHQLNLLREPKVNDEREKMTYADTMSFLPDDCLFKVDRMSMANGLEVRVPFLDRELVEFSARIPFKFKIRGLISKYILKKAFRPYLPLKILKQRKQGFTIPISKWLQGELGTLVEKILLNGQLEQRKLFKQKQLKWMIESHRSGKQEFGHRLWSLAIFEIWAKLYLDDKISSAPDLSLEQMIE